jgi:hypothetical protein
MTTSFTFSESASFTVTHARHMAAKVATDLKRIQRLYGAPSDLSIADYEAELIGLMKADYLGTVTYGFRRDGAWIVPTLRYTAQDLSGAVANDDDPGRIRPGADITGASFYSYLTYSAFWNRLTSDQQTAFKRTLGRGAPTRIGCRVIRSTSIQAAPERSRSACRLRSGTALSQTPACQVPGFRCSPSK